MEFAVITCWFSQDRIIRQHEECQADRDQKDKAAEKAQADRE